MHATRFSTAATVVCHLWIRIVIIILEFYASLFSWTSEIFVIERHPDEIWLDFRYGLCVFGGQPWSIYLTEVVVAASIGCRTLSKRKIKCGQFRCINSQVSLDDRQTDKMYLNIIHTTLTYKHELGPSGPDWNDYCQNNFIISTCKIYRLKKIYYEYKNNVYPPNNIILL